MRKHKLPKPTEAELQILQVLWEHGPSTVRFVNERLNQRREVGYTTTLKLMQIMAGKGLAARDTSSRTHIYRAVLQEEDARTTLMEQLVQGAFRGSAMQLVMQALGNHKASREELSAIKDLIRKMEEEE